MSCKVSKLYNDFIFSTTNKHVTYFNIRYTRNAYSYMLSRYPIPVQICTSNLLEKLAASLATHTYTWPYPASDVMNAFVTFSNASANKRHGNGIFKWNFVRVFSPFSALFIILHCHAAPRIPCHNINTTCLPELIHLFCSLALFPDIQRR